MATPVFCLGCKTTHDPLRACPRGEAHVLALKLEVTRAAKATASAEVPGPEKTVEPAATMKAVAPPDAGRGKRGRPVKPKTATEAMAAYLRYLEKAAARTKKWREKKDGG